MGMLNESQLKEKMKIVLKSRDGYSARLLKWHNAKDVDIVFEDGKIQKHLKW